MNIYTPDLAAMNDQQAETIKALWVQNARLQQRVDDLQTVVDRRDRRIIKLQDEATAQARAERCFK